MSAVTPFQFKHYRPRPLEIIDTTLREGSQTSLLHDHYKYFFNQNDKMEIARALIVFGVKFIELFAPIVSAQERDDFAAIREVRDELIMQKGYTFLLAHVRCHPDDVASAVEAGADGLNFYIGLSEASRLYNHGKDFDDIIRRARSLLEEVRRHHPHLILRFSGEDAFRTPEPHLFRVYDQIVPFVDRLGTPDTVGVATPTQVAQRIKALRERYPAMDFEGHFHDDRGFGLVNALEAAKSGMRYMNTTLLGVGERSGITSMTALFFNLYIDKAYDHLEGYNLRGSYPINVMFASKLKKLVPSKEPVSLTNRTHTAGVHQKALLNNAGTYEAFPLDQFGVSESEVLLGPLSGWNIIHYFLKEIKGYNLDEGTARQIATAFKDRVYNIGPQDSPTQILIEIAENQFGLSHITVPERFKDNILQRMDAEAESMPEPSPQVQPEGRRNDGEIAETYGREAAVSLKR
jgi:homocitrate synthase